MTTPERVCPRCERRRTGYLRYCLRCGFDYDAPVPMKPDLAIEAVTKTQAIAPEVASGNSPTPPHRIGRYLVIGTAAVLGLGVLLSTTTMRPSSPPTPAPRPSAAATTVPTPDSIGSATLGPTGPTEVGIVSRIVDGDTIIVKVDGVEVPVRYIGMDTLEPNATEPLTKQLADAATAANASLVGGREVIMERDISETDPFNRLLRHVWIRDDAGTFVLVNLELVRLGFALVSTFPPDVKYVDLLTTAQESARLAGLGLWAPAPTPTEAARHPSGPAAVSRNARRALVDDVLPARRTPPSHPDWPRQEAAPRSTCRCHANGTTAAPLMLRPHLRGTARCDGTTPPHTPG